MYKLFIKRTIDLILSFIMFVFLLPIFFIVFLTLFYTHRGNPFFLQMRPGKDGRIFKIIKFKTMSDFRDKNNLLLPDEFRMTKMGSFIRNWSLDEIPQLINVLKGDMSLIGPRPLLPEYLPLYSEFQNRRHNVKPGITGWAQINGRNAISWNEKFELDIWYVNHMSFMVDVRILLFTIKKVLITEGISSVDSVTMEKFKGN